MTYVCVDGLGFQILESDLSATPYQAIIKATGFFINNKSPGDIFWKISIKLR